MKKMCMRLWNDKIFGIYFSKFKWYAFMKTARTGTLDAIICVHHKIYAFHIYISMAFWWFVINFLCDYKWTRFAPVFFLFAFFKMCPKNLLFIKVKLHISIFSHFHQSLMCLSVFWWCASIKNLSNMWTFFVKTREREKKQATPNKIGLKMDLVITRCALVCVCFF